MVVSSYLAAQIVDPVFGDPAQRSAPDALFGTLGYAIVIYADFSGYTDIAIGVAKLLGFQFPRNFDRPYAARSIQDFWRRWHMTLSRWLRDYLYIPWWEPARGKEAHLRERHDHDDPRGPLARRAWTFVFWGAFHGGLLAAHLACATAEADTKATGKGRLDFMRQRAATFALVCVGWVFFRADSMETAFSLLGRLITGWWTPSESLTPLVVFRSPACSRCSSGLEASVCGCSRGSLD